MRDPSPAAGRTRDATYPPAPEPLPVPVLDSHCHLDIGRHGEDIGRHGEDIGRHGEDIGRRGEDTSMTVEEAVAAATAVGVSRIVQVGCDLPSARWSVEEAVRHPTVVAAVSLHPNEAPRIHAEAGRAALEAAWDEIDRLAAHPRVRAVGESGLDYFRTGEDGRAVQEESFRRHVAMAKAHRKALVVHDRDAHEDVLRVLDDEGAPDVVVLHCFSGDADLARRCVARGWVLSFAGTVTFANAGYLREALAVTPLDQVLVETDAPFLTPMPYRGRPNASFLVPYTLRAMAQVRGVDVADLAAAVDATGTRVFGAF